jgi:hypothetical protein
MIKSDAKSFNVMLKDGQLGSVDAASLPTEEALQRPITEIDNACTGKGVPCIG